MSFQHTSAEGAHLLHASLKKMAIRETMEQTYSLIRQHFDTTKLLVEQCVESLREDHVLLPRFARIVQAHERGSQTPSSDTSSSQGC
jgi:hypothetical protein